jgi:hypothetical protein
MLITTAPSAEEKGGTCQLCHGSGMAFLRMLRSQRLQFWMKGHSKGPESAKTAHDAAGACMGWDYSYM